MGNGLEWNFDEFEGRRDEKDEKRGGMNKEEYLLVIDYFLKSFPA